jgi:hypothetical protein
MANRILFTTAAQVGEAFPGAAGDLGDLPQNVSPLDHLATLAAGSTPKAAIVFAALALPKREAVGWGCIALRGMGALSGDDRTCEGLRLAEAWVRHPGEDERRAAGRYAESQYFDGAGAWIAFAAFTTGGSLAEAGLQAVPPSPDMSGKCVAMAVVQATDDADTRRRLANLRVAIESARDFAGGGTGTNPWNRQSGHELKAAVTAG